MRGNSTSGCGALRSEVKNMASEIALGINTVKAQPEPELERFIRQVSSQLAPARSLVRELRCLLEGEDVHLGQDQEEFLDGVILACVLADIGTQLSDSPRASNIGKIESIAARRALPYPELARASVYADDLLELIERHISGD